MEETIERIVSFFRHAAPEALLLGPGSIHVAHTPYEKLSKQELLEAVDLYIAVAKRLLA